MTGVVAAEPLALELEVLDAGALEAFDAFDVAAVVVVLALWASAGS
jgi:hypothetical protein